MGNLLLLISSLIAVYGFIIICDAEDELWDWVDKYEEDFEITYDD